MKTKIVNLTPHGVSICGDDGAVIRTIQPEAVAARVASTTRIIGEVDGIPVTASDFGEVTGLPTPKPGVVYIVSLQVQLACPKRDDLLRPDTGPKNVVRDASGNIVGVKALAR